MPAVAPSVHEVTAAMPELLLVAVVPPDASRNEPAPLPMAKVTVTPDLRRSHTRSRTRTAGAVATLAPTAAL